MTSAKTTCPICNRPVSAEGKDRPFCSQRCREVDFFRWSDGKYAIVEPLDDPFDMDEDPRKLADPEG